MKPTFARRHRIRLGAAAMMVLCGGLALLAGTLPAGAAPRQAAAAKTIEATVTVGAARALPARALPGLAAKPPAASAQCAPALNRFDRSDSCTNAIITITFLMNEKPVGDMVVTIEQSMHLKAGSKHWIENDTVTNVDPVGEVPAGVEADMVATCGPPCVASARFAGVVETGLRGTVGYFDGVPFKRSHQTQTTYTLDITAPGFVPGPPPVWKSGLEYRCDQDVAVSKSGGCVFPEFTPTLILSHRAYGAAAYMIAWAQTFMHKHWGYPLAVGRPALTRASAAQGRTNRRRICNSTFRNFGTVTVNGHPDDRDSCDEFPFAATGQSGAQQGAVGQQCVQLKAVHNTTRGNEPAQWSTTVVIGTPNLNTVCVRAHIPGKENSAVGGAYGAFIQRNRLFLKEKFWVLVIV